MMKTMFGDFEAGSEESGSTPAAIAAIPSAAPRSTDLRVTLSDERWSVFRCSGTMTVGSPSVPLLDAVFSAGMRRTYQTARRCANRLVDRQAKNQKSIDANSPTRVSTPNTARNTPRRFTNI
jgi:hypothetical protein